MGFLVKNAQLHSKPNLLLRHRAGVSNSVSHAGHILTKKGSRATLRGKMPAENSSFSNNLSNFNDVSGRTNTSGGPHV